MELSNDISNFVYTENDIVFVYSGINNENAEHIELESSLCLSDSQLLHGTQFVEYIAADIQKDPVSLYVSTDNAGTSTNLQQSASTPSQPPAPLVHYSEPPKNEESIKKPKSQIYVCEICSEAFTTQTKIKRHIKQNHLYTKPHKCDQCAAEFNVLSNLLLHSSLHNKRPFRCPQCGHIFKRLSSLDGHIRSHFKSEYFVCSHCGEMFHYEICLKEHMLKVHPTENYKLQEQKAAKAKARKLAKGKKLKCQFCDKEFKKNCLLLRHERIHKNERPYKCEYENCNSAFVQKNSLVIHTLRHSGARPHQCTKCPQSFTQKGNLVVHTLRCHSESSATDFPYPCTQCTCMFKKLGTLNAHISKCHTGAPIATSQSGMENDEFEITNVMDQLAQIRRPDLISQQMDDEPALPITETLLEPSQWSDPMLSNNVFNEETTTIIPNAANLSVPIIENSTLKVAEHTSDGTINHRIVKQKITENMRWLICIYCPKQFRRPSDLLRHIRIHTKEKPYQCPDPQCKRRFAIKSTLNVHMRVHEKNPRRHTCPTCSKTFSAANTLDFHCTSTHGTIQAFKCAHCPAAFTTSNAFKSHYRKNHAITGDGNGQTKSTTTGNTKLTQLGDDDDLQIDVKMEEPIHLIDDSTINKTKVIKVGSHKCNICDLSFRKSSTLKNHIQSHLGTKLYKCELCEKYDQYFEF